MSIKIDQHNHLQALQFPTLYRLISSCALNTMHIRTELWNSVVHDSADRCIPFRISTKVNNVNKNFEQNLSKRYQ